MSHPTITGHMLVQNEDRFIWFAIQSVLPHLDQLLITDNGSTDKTIDIINTFNSPKIKLTKLPPTDRAGLIERRRHQLQATKTDWFLLIDGDEIWPESAINTVVSTLKTGSPETVAFVCRTRNCVGDIYHYQDESAGQYHLLGKTGHYTIRLIRKMPEIQLTGEYPLEAYTFNSTPLDKLTQPQLEFLDVWYLHTTHLPRTTNQNSASQVIDRVSKFKLERGIALPKEELPEVFFNQNIPPIVPDPFEIKYSRSQRFLSTIQTPLKKLKRKFNNR